MYPLGTVSPLTAKPTNPGCANIEPKTIKANPTSNTPIALNDLVQNSIKIPQAITKQPNEKQTIPTISNTVKSVDPVLYRMLAPKNGKSISKKKTRRKKTHKMRFEPP